MSEITGRVGYYDSPDQASDKPAYDPPHNSNCPICEKPITPDDIRTLSLRNNDSVCLFYRTHRTCHQGLIGTDAEGNLDHKMFEEGVRCGIPGATNLGNEPIGGVARVVVEELLKIEKWAEEQQSVKFDYERNRVHYELKKAASQAADYWKSQEARP